MSNVLVVTSGKGGVGKTTSAAALGAALAEAGQQVAVVDFDVGLRNLDLVLGAERRVVFDMVNVIQGEAKLQQALIRDKRLENLWLLPASLRLSHQSTPWRGDKLPLRSYNSNETADPLYNRRSGASQSGETSRPSRPPGHGLSGSSPSSFHR